MARIKLLTDLSHNGTQAAAGSIVEIDDETAGHLIDIDSAVEADSAETQDLTSTTDTDEDQE